MNSDLCYANGSPYLKEEDGKKYYYYPEGQLKTVVLPGETVLYWSNGKMKRRCHFLAGVRHGVDEMWDESGKLLDQGSYENGKPVGIHRRFSPNGQVLEEIEYLDSSRFNLRSWDEKGTLRVEALWNETHYREKVWDRFQNIWIEKEGSWDGKKLVYV